MPGAGEGYGCCYFKAAFLSEVVSPGEAAGFSVLVGRYSIEVGCCCSLNYESDIFLMLLISSSLTALNVVLCWDYYRLSYWYVWRLYSFVAASSPDIWRANIALPLPWLISQDGALCIIVLKPCWFLRNLKTSCSADEIGVLPRFLSGHGDIFCSKFASYSSIS